MDDDILLFALPIFGVLMALEFSFGIARRRNNYGWSDTLSSLGQGLLSQVVALCTRAIQVGLYAAAWPYIALAPKAALWAHPLGIVVAVVAYDFCDYWLHRVSHERALFWAAHAPHHQSEHFNFSTALRQESAYGITGCVFFLPMALVGVPPRLFGIAAIVVLFYQFWIHTEHVGRLGLLDRLLSTPSNHRVHHAVNDRYLDRNYGAIFVVWDRMFGTFQPECADEPCVYGTTLPLRSWDPLRAVGGPYLELWRRCAHAPRWRNRFALLLAAPAAPPGPDGLPVAAPPTHDRRRYAPVQSASQRWAAGALFLGALSGTGALLWTGDTLGALPLGASSVAVVAVLWVMGAALEARVSAARALVVGLPATAAAIAIALLA